MIAPMLGPAMVAGVAYLASQDGSYRKQTTSSQGQVVYQTVPAPEGAKLTTLPAPAETSCCTLALRSAKRRPDCLKHHSDSIECLTA